MAEDPIEMPASEEHRDALETLYAAAKSVWEGGSYLTPDSCFDLLIAMKKAETALGISE